MEKATFKSQTIRHLPGEATCQDCDSDYFHTITTVTITMRGDVEERRMSRTLCGSCIYSRYM